VRGVARGETRKLKDEGNEAWQRGTGYILCLKKGYHPTTNNNFNSRCSIRVIFGINIVE